MFLSASLLPVLLGTSWGYRSTQTLDWSALLLALAAILCVHAAINVLNDVFDELSGNDRLNAERIFPYTGGSRVIQNGVMSLRAMALWGILLLLAGALFGLLLTLEKGPTVLILGLLGATLGVLYSAPPLQLGARGWGEAAVGLGLGILPVTGAAWLQAGEVTTGTWLVSLPVACWVTAILLINEVPDRKADAATGKRTLVVRWGVANTALLYGLLQAVAFALIVLMAGLGRLPSFALALALPTLLLLAALYAAGGLGSGQARLKRGIQLTLAIHALGCLWLTAWLLAPGTHGA